MLFKKICTLFAEEQDRWSLWLPVAFGVGIGVYFALKTEPSLALGIGAFIFSASGALLLRKKTSFFLFFLFLCFLTGGFLRIQTAAHLAKAPRLERSYFAIAGQGTIETTKVTEDGWLFVIKDVSLKGTAPEKTPAKIQLRFKTKLDDFFENERISFIADLKPIPLETYPGTYSFARSAWFDKIGAIGVIKGTPKLIQKAAPISSFLQRTRFIITERIKMVLPPHQAQIAIPLTTGEQGYASKETYQTYRDAGIVHVLSVSGFHMTLIAGFIFIVVRFLLSLLPQLALRMNIKKVSAVVALCFTFAYLLISGMAIPAQRSFFMIAVILGAVLLDRQPLSIRNVCWAAFVLLMISPQTLMSASFQLSFGAVVALIAGYEAFGKSIHRMIKATPRWAKGLVAFLLGFLLTNLVAHFATAPFGIYHFHRYSHYAILGNFLTSSLFGLLIMPLLLVGVLLIPFGLDRYPLIAAGYGLEYVEKMASFVAGLPGASVVLPAFSTAGFLLMIAGGLWLCLWRKKWRYGGWIFIVFGALTLFNHPLPDIIAAGNGRLYAFQQTPGVLSFSTHREKRLQARFKEENGIDPKTPFKRIPYAETSHRLKGYRIVLDAEYCEDADIAFVKSDDYKTHCPASIVISKNDLQRKGTHLLYLKENGVLIENVADKAGNRLWTLPNK